MLLLLGVDGRNISTARVPISKSRDVRGKSTMGETSVAVRRLRRVTESVRVGGRASGDTTGR